MLMAMIMTQVMLTWFGKMSPRWLSSKGKKVGMADFGLRLAVTAQQMRITCMQEKHQHHAEWAWVWVWASVGAMLIEDELKYEHQYANEDEVGNLDDPIDEQPSDIPEHQVGFWFLLFQPSLPSHRIQAAVTFDANASLRGCLHAAKLKSGVVVFGNPITCPAADFVRCLVLPENQRVSQNSQAPK